MAFSVTSYCIWREGAGLIKDKLIRSRSRAATPIGCVRPNICIRVIGLLGLEVSTKPEAIQEYRDDDHYLDSDLKARLAKTQVIDGLFRVI
ncbi:hypothetical protein SAMN05216605_10241 [Pseudomonas abietaniphila]|jgi:hypothetical protein|uniref:Uncharacterized protein n=1 Tax=Pseudomonas abietaniphila TaxID=89065 RepID=A0A1G7U429_9PSED|nr:hypothetical protein SAMN05216605_10241 [Pseudomonas abietaniphila]